MAAKLDSGLDLTKPTTRIAHCYNSRRCSRRHPQVLLEAWIWTRGIPSANSSCLPASRRSVAHKPLMKSHPRPPSSGRRQRAWTTSNSTRLTERRLDGPPGNSSCSRQSHERVYPASRLALTEDKPMIKPYDESLWANLADARLPIDVSQTLLDCVTQTLGCRMASDEGGRFRAAVDSPRTGERNVDWLLFVYEWHGNTTRPTSRSFAERKGW